MWYIIRHGQTLENRLNIQQGQTESLLTLKGIIQAQSIGYRLLEQDENFSDYTFVSSPLARARHTLQIIMEILSVSNEKQAVVEQLLINRNKGILQGVDKNKIKELFSEEFKKRESNQWTYKAPNGGESKEESYLRVKKFIEKYKNQKNLIIVGHRNINWMIQEILKGSSMNEIKNNSNKKEKSQNYFYCWNGEKITKI